MAELPPLPPGFTLDQPQQASSPRATSQLPPLPPGFTLDKPANEASMPPTGMEHFMDTLRVFARHPLTAGAGLAENALGSVTGGVGSLAEAVTGQDPGSIDLAYRPRTQAGQEIAALGGQDAQKIGQQYDRFAGTGPLAQTLKERIPQAAGAVGTVTGIAGLRGAFARVPGNVGPGITPRVTAPAAGEAGAASETAAAARPSRLAQVSEEAPAKAGVAPTVEELAQQKNAAYKAAKDAGVVISRQGLNRLKVRILTDLKQTGINEKLHPKAAAVAEDIAQTKGQPSLQDIDTLRQLANDAKGATDKADAFRGAKIVEHIDDFLDDLKPEDVVGGDSQGGVAALTRARELNTRLRKTQTIADLVDRAKTKAGAQYTQAGLEHALRAEFKTLALNKRELRGFSPAEQAAIKSIARGSPIENALRNIGKFDPTSGGMAAFISALLAGGGAASTGGASLLIPVAGFAAKRAATRMASRKIGNFDEMVRRGPPIEPGNALATPRARNAFAETRK